MTDRELLAQALEALLEVNYDQAYAKEVAALSERLAQPEQEPVATVRCINGITIGYLEVMQPVGTKLYTTPPQRKPLTDEEIRQTADQRGIVIVGEAMIAFARAIEAAHGIKENT